MAAAVAVNEMLHCTHAAAALERVPVRVQDDDRIPEK
jgi:hypothetical protein